MYYQDLGVCAMQIKPIVATCSRSAEPDEEHKRIMRKLMAYGIMPTGIKTTDFNLLKKFELEEAKKEPCVSTKFITVSTEEQAKIQEKKNKKKVEKNPEIYPEKMQGQQILAEQIKVAIEMQNKKITLT